MSFEQWLASVPARIKADDLWRVEAYRLALFLCDLAWPDSTKLMREKRTVSLADQLYRAVAGIRNDPLVIT